MGQATRHEESSPAAQAPCVPQVGTGFSITPIVAAQGCADWERRVHAEEVGCPALGIGKASVTKGYRDPGL